MPLTIALGTALAALVLTDLTIWEAAIVGTVLAPTDAALGQAVVSNLRVPARMRQGLNVEAGLNDGLSVPFLALFLTLAEAEEEHLSASVWVRFRWYRGWPVGRLAAEPGLARRMDERFVPAPRPAVTGAHRLGTAEKQDEIR
jgi:NhaP-type Na+/H+ and K+/H+ antiporter